MRKCCSDRCADTSKTIAAGIAFVALYAGSGFSWFLTNSNRFSTNVNGTEKFLGGETNTGVHLWPAVAVGTSVAGLMLLPTVVRGAKRVCGQVGGLFCQSQLNSGGNGSNDLTSGLLTEEERKKQLDAQTVVDPDALTSGVRP